MQDERRRSGRLSAVDIDVVRKAPLFAALDDEAAKALMESMTSSHLERGDILFREGDQGDRLYVIGEGKIKLGLTSVDGRENLLAVLGPGEMFGELSLFDPGPRTATATAIAETQLIALGHEDLDSFLLGRPAVAANLLAATGPSPSSHQRDPGRPGLHRRARPGGQGPARSVHAFRPPRPRTASLSRTS